MAEVKIVEWLDEYREDFSALSREWLEKYLIVEPFDLEIMNDPRGLVLDGGGQIFFAECGGRLVGTVAMINHGGGAFELAKLAVTEDFKGLKIGRQLMAAGLDFARERGAELVFLYTNRILTPAIALYHAFGFEEAPMDEQKYLESDMKMEFIL